MSYYQYVPSPPLSAFVNIFWLYEGNLISHAKERVLPNGSVELVINLRDDLIQIYQRNDPGQSHSFNGCVLAGAQSNYFVIDTASQQSIIGIHFRPGGAFPFFKFPADELHNEHVSLDTFWGTKTIELRERLLAAPTPQAKFHLLEQYLLAQASQPLTRHPAVTFALKELQNRPATRPLSEVVAQIGLSQRRFIQLFSQEVGLTPKLFWRVQRFQEVLQRIGSEEILDWTEVALTCGYFDQAHFIHDFRAFSGLNPTSYLARRTEHQNHVPLPE